MREELVCRAAGLIIAMKCDLLILKGPYLRSHHNTFGIHKTLFSKFIGDKFMFPLISLKY